MQGVVIAGYKAGLNALYWTRAHKLFGPSTRGSGAILMFHKVRPRRASGFRPNAYLEVTPHFLELAVRRIREQDIDIVDLDEAGRRLQEPPGERRFVVLTFDDGYRDNYTEAYPVLKALGAPFTVYFTTGFVDRIAAPWWDILASLIETVPHLRMSVGERLFDLPTRSIRQKRFAWQHVTAEFWRVGEDEQRHAIDVAAREHGIDALGLLDQEMMNWDEVRALARDPLVTVGAHTVGHYALGRVDLERARSEMAESQERIAAMTGTRPHHFSYPYGTLRAAGDREFALADELGFATAVTTRRGVLADENRRAALPRISMNGHYQASRYVDVLLSGVPMALERRLHGLWNSFGRR